jgi:hypothetical protein
VSIKFILYSDYGVHVIRDTPVTTGKSMWKKSVRNWQWSVEKINEEIEEDISEIKTGLTYAK